MTIVAGWQRHNAEIQRKKSIVAMQDAEKARLEAVKAMQEAEKSRIEAEQARRVAEERTDTLLKQFGWESSRLSSGSLDQYSVQQSLTANQDLQQATLRSPKKSRKNVTVQYFPKDVDGEKVESAIQELGFTLDMKRAPISGTATNSIWYGKPVKIEDVKLVAFTLIRAGVQIKAIRPFADYSPRRNAALIQVGADVSVADKAPLSVEEIRDASQFVR
jgi:hypothetical protein